MSVCLATATVVVALGWSTFTLSWTHSVEKIAWQEDWRVTPAGLEIVEARVKGTGAGMEPPPEATFADGWWHYRPPLGLLPRLTLARSGAVADWRLCRHGGCVTPERLVGAETGAISLYPCPR
jgi:hypothetical protein